jgi:hypothetical protein
MGKTVEFIFFVTLFLYLVTLFRVPYVGVYLTYVAIPVIVISGLIAKFTVWK